MATCNFSVWQSVFWPLFFSVSLEILFLTQQIRTALLLTTFCCYLVYPYSLSRLGLRRVFWWRDSRGRGQGSGDWGRGRSRRGRPPQENDGGQAGMTDAAGQGADGDDTTWHDIFTAKTKLEPGEPKSSEFYEHNKISCLYYLESHVWAYLIPLFAHMQDLDDWITYKLYYSTYKTSSECLTIKKNSGMLALMARTTFSWHLTALSQLSVHWSSQRYEDTWKKGTLGRLKRFWVACSWLVYPSRSWITVLVVA